MDHCFTAVHGIQQRIAHKTNIGEDRHDLIRTIIFSVCPKQSRNQLCNHKHDSKKDQRHSQRNQQCRLIFQCFRIHAGGNDQRRIADINDDTGDHLAGIFPEYSDFSADVPDQHDQEKNHHLLK